MLVWLPSCQIRRLYADLRGWQRERCVARLSHQDVLIAVVVAGLCTVLGRSAWRMWRRMGGVESQRASDVVMTGMRQVRGDLRLV